MSVNLTEADVAEIERQFKALGKAGEDAGANLKQHIHRRNPLTGLTDAEHARVLARLRGQAEAELHAQAKAGDAG